MPKLFFYLLSFLLLALPQHAAVQSSNQPTSQQNASVGLGAVGQTLNIPYKHPIHGEGWHDTVVILGVAPGGRAEAQGLQIGDALLAFNDVYVTKRKEILLSLANMKAGEPLCIKVMRKGKVFDINLHIKEEALIKMQNIRALMATHGAITDYKPPHELSAEEEAAKKINTTHSPLRFELNDEQKIDIKAASQHIKSELAKGLDKADIPSIVKSLYLIRNTLKSVSTDETDWIKQADAAASIRFKQNNHALVIQASGQIMTLEVYNPKGVLIYKVDSSDASQLALCPASIKKLLASLASL